MNLCACGRESSNVINWASFGKSGFGFYCPSCYPAVLRVLNKHIKKMKEEADGNSVHEKKSNHGEEDQALGACVR